MSRAGRYGAVYPSHHAFGHRVPFVNRRFHITDMLRAKIHHAYITDRDEGYIGSIVLEGDLMLQVDLWNYEKGLSSAT